MCVTLRGSVFISAAQSLHGVVGMHKIDFHLLITSSHLLVYESIACSQIFGKGDLELVAHGRRIVLATAAQTTPLLRQSKNRRIMFPTSCVS